MKITDAEILLALIYGKRVKRRNWDKDFVTRKYDFNLSGTKEISVYDLDAGDWMVCDEEDISY